MARMGKDALDARLASLRARVTKIAGRPPDAAKDAGKRTRKELTAILKTLSDLEDRIPAQLPPRPAIQLPAALATAPPVEGETRVRAARRLNRASAMLAASVLLDSGLEHYRGSFENKAMFTPLVTSTLTLLISLHGTADKRPSAHLARDITYALAALTGVAGTGFHLYNVGSRTGGFAWQNLFYGAPLGAPAAILLSGLLGVYSERIRESRVDTTPTVFGLPAGRALAALTGAGLLGTSGEAGLLHFRGAYHDPFMFAPVTIPPVAALLMAETAFGTPGRNRRFTGWWMRLTALLGFVGVGFHAYGVSRNMGGWRNWSQNILNGPPLPAPPSFTGLALAGLAALGLLKDHPDA